MQPEPSDPLDNLPPGLAREIAELPSGLPAIVLLGDTIALSGSLAAGKATPGGEGGGDVAELTFTVPACTCPNTEFDVDPFCARHYPEPSRALLHLVARAISKSRTWAQTGSGIAGATAGDVNAAHAVLDVLLRPGRNGVLP